MQARAFRAIEGQAAATFGSALLAADLALGLKKPTTFDQKAPTGAV